MVEIHFDTIQNFFQTNWSMAAGLAGAMVALTAFASSILAQDRKDSVALWLMGAQSEENWAKSFVALFDAVFGENHLSSRCMIRSVIASLVAVFVIWLLMGIGDAYSLRLQADLALGEVLIYALAINLIADYLSLLETRWLLGWLAKPRHFVVHLLVLIADVLVSGAIVWLAIVAFIASPFYSGEAESFAEILGVFSIFSVLFYSTFVTSLWCWAFIGSTWLLRAFTHLDLQTWLTVENKPFRILGMIMAANVFLGTFAAATVLRTDDDGVTALDRTLCTLFKGAVCLDVARLTKSEQIPLNFLLLACEGGETEECVLRAIKLVDLTPQEAAPLFRAACGGADAKGCTYLGHLHSEGIGVALDMEEAARLYRLGCEGGDLGGCNDLALLYQKGQGVTRDLDEAIRLHELACDMEEGVSCANLAVLYFNGSLVTRDIVAAERFFQLGCEYGSVEACTALGYELETGRRLPKDINEAARLYRISCDGGHGRACNNLGRLHAADENFQEAGRLYRMGCDLEHALSCSDLAWLYRNGSGRAVDNAEARHLYREAARLYQIRCSKDEVRACGWARQALERSYVLDGG